MVPHMVYFVDLAVRGRGLDPRLGALTWLLFGVGAMAGTLIGGRAADHWGGAHALKLWLVFQVVALALALPPSTASLFASALLGGFAGLGVSAVALARTRELAGSAAGVVWVRATALYALAQAAAGFVLTPLFAHTGSHASVFVPVLPCPSQRCCSQSPTARRYTPPCKAGFQAGAVVTSAGTPCPDAGGVRRPISMTENLKVWVPVH